MSGFLRRALLILCVLQLGGAHWLTLQSAAWVSMLVSRTVESDFETAVETTFDGNHPCGMCKVVKEGKKQEGDQGGTKAFLTQLSLADYCGLPAAVAVVPPAENDFQFGVTVFQGSSRSLVPPGQPPRWG